MKPLVAILLAFPLSVYADIDPPPHDNFAGAAVVAWPATAGTTVSSTIQAGWSTAEPGEPAHGGVPAALSVWWKFTAGSTGAAAIDVSVYGTSAVYVGNSLATLSPLLPLNAAQRIYPVVAGTTYMVAANNPSGYAGFATLRVTPLNLLQYANDAFASRTTVASGVGANYSRYPVSNTYYGALVHTWYYGSNEAGEPALPDGVTETVWWEFTAPATDYYYADELSQAFTGSTLANLQPLLPAPFNSSPYFHLQQGQTVIFRSFPHASGFGFFFITKADRYDVFLINAGLPSNQQSRNSNPAGDGISNLTKFLLGLDPSKTVTRDPNAGHLPKIVPRGDGRLEVVYTLDVVAANQIYDYELGDNMFFNPIYSSDLQTWTHLGAEYLVQDETTRFKEHRFLLPANLPQVFVRLNLEYRDFGGND